MTSERAKTLLLWLWLIFSNHVKYLSTRLSYPPSNFNFLCVMRMCYMYTFRYRATNIQLDFITHSRAMGYVANENQIIKGVFEGIKMVNLFRRGFPAALWPWPANRFTLVTAERLPSTDWIHSNNNFHPSRKHIATPHTLLVKIP